MEEEVWEKKIFAFRPSPKTYDIVQKYMKTNGLGQGERSRALNEMLESLGNDQNFPNHVRVECLIKKTALKNIAVSLLKDDPET